MFTFYISGFAPPAYTVCFINISHCQFWRFPHSVQYISVKKIRFRMHTYLVEKLPEKELKKTKRERLKVIEKERER